MSIIEAEHTARLDAAGVWRARLPLTDPRTAEATVGRYWLQFREGEGLAFAGIIENISKQPEETLELSGPTIMGELLYKNTLLNRQYTGTLNAAVDGLLALASGWTRNGSDTTTINARFDGESVLRALLALIDQPRIHLRELVTESGGILTKKVDIGAFGASAGVTMTGGNPDDVVIQDSALAYVESLQVLETVAEVWNYIIPLGAGDGKAQLTLRHSTRTTPYTIQTVAGPDGATIYYISDAASITTYGQRERAFVAKDIGPLSNTKAALVAAANALYDIAVRQIQWWKDKQTAYRLTVRGLKPGVKPGDKVRLRWRGYAEHWDAGYVYLDVDTELWVLERTRRFLNDGTEVSTLVVSDLERQLQSATEVVIGKLEDTARAFRTKVQASVSNRSAWAEGPLNASYTFPISLLIDDNVTQLLRCKLRINPRPIRSTATGAASGGAAANTGGPSVPDTSGPSTPDTSGTSTPNTTGPSPTDSTQESPAHFHVSLSGTTGIQAAHSHGVLNDLGSVADSAINRAFRPAGSGPDVHVSSPGTGDIVSSSTNEHAHTPGSLLTVGGAHTHGLNTHTHPMAHTHTLSAHTHTLSGHVHVMGNHVHGQTYGIFEGTSPLGMTVTINGVDRTGALGGPWNAAATLDITAYLLDSDGVVVQQVHTIAIGSTQLGRVECWLDLVEIVQSIIAS